MTYLQNLKATQLKEKQIKNKSFDYSLITNLESKLKRNTLIEETILISIFIFVISIIIFI